MPKSGYFDVVFAVDGDLTSVPDAIQVSGAISYTQGWGAFYSQDPTVDPSTALLIDRAQTNQLFNDVTVAIQYEQQGNAAAWISSTMNGGTPFSYNQYATVLFTDGHVYESLVPANTETPTNDGINWKIVDASESTVVPSAITGCLPTSISGINTSAAVAISAGTASDSTATVNIVCAGYSWSVSNGNHANGYQGGATLPNSSSVHFYVMTGSAGTASFASLSLTPTLPTGYSTYRRIFSVLTDGSGSPIPYSAIEVGGGSMQTYFTAPQVDYQALGNYGPSTHLVSVPNLLNVVAQCLFVLGGSTGTTVRSCNVSYYPTASSVLVGTANAAFEDNANECNIGIAGDQSVHNLAVSSASGDATLTLTTIGWLDPRE